MGFPERQELPMDTIISQSVILRIITHLFITLFLFRLYFFELFVLLVLNYIAVGATKPDPVFAACCYLSDICIENKLLLNVHV